MPLNKQTKNCAAATVISTRIAIVIYVDWGARGVAVARSDGCTVSSDQLGRETVN